MKNKNNSFETSVKMNSQVSLQLNRISPALRAFSLYLTSNDFDNDDLYQDTVLKILSNVEKYTINSNFKGWALTIMHNIFIDNYRKKKKQANSFASISNNYNVNSDNYRIENNGEMRMAYKNLLRNVSALPEKFKRPFWMSYSGYKYQEIAMKLEVPLGTIKKRIYCARQKLQTMYLNG